MIIEKELAETEIQALADEMQKLSAFSQLTKDDLFFFCSIAERVSYVPDELLVTNGSLAEYLIVLLEGSFSLRFKRNGQSEELIRL